MQNRASIERPNKPFDRCFIFCFIDNFLHNFIKYTNIRAPPTKISVSRMKSKNRRFYYMKKLSKKLKNIFQPANRLQVGLLECRYKSKKEVGICEVQQNAVK